MASVRALWVVSVNAPRRLLLSRRFPTVDRRFTTQIGSDESVLKAIAGQDLTRSGVLAVRGASDDDVFVASASATFVVVVLGGRQVALLVEQAGRIRDFIEARLAPEDGWLDATVNVSLALARAMPFGTLLQDQLAIDSDPGIADPHLVLEETSQAFIDHEGTASDIVHVGEIRCERGRGVLPIPGVDDEGRGVVRVVSVHERVVVEGNDMSFSGRMTICKYVVPAPREYVSSCTFVMGASATNQAAIDVRVAARFEADVQDVTVSVPLRQGAVVVSGQGVIDGDIAWWRLGDVTQGSRIALAMAVRVPADTMRFDRYARLQFKAPPALDSVKVDQRRHSCEIRIWNRASSPAKQSA
ncbi:unnamed protein product (mitochondrion) [Plasmodiophora brassicae]|uniref:MHD domain-containing protein n=1 Tax=Plasmodiophora brassicae TaxID=37360 RepID=A0A0G4IHM0_PLABS|nr:hypothetical protein PBRA_000360 [Plasmodiophora brassicae]SPQ96920.1 unnamed protein product [Plasmodiophora brassicae]